MIMNMVYLFQLDTLVFGLCINFIQYCHNRGTAENLDVPLFPDRESAGNLGGNVKIVILKNDGENWKHWDFCLGNSMATLFYTFFPIFFHKSIYKGKHMRYFVNRSYVSTIYLCLITNPLFEGLTRNIKSLTFAHQTQIQLEVFLLCWFFWCNNNWTKDALVLGIGETLIPCSCRILNFTFDVLLSFKPFLVSRYLTKSKVSSHFFLPFFS